jgi:ATP-binding cassette subfamily B protein/subfamily B ATP-binding cassette protein MsbA
VKIRGHELHIVPKRFRFTKLDKKTGEQVGAWDQWKAAPRIIPFMRGYKKLLIVSILLSIVVSIVSLAEPWPFAIVIDSVLGTHSPPKALQPLFGDQPDPYRLLVFMAGLGFMIAVASHGIRVINDYVNAKVEQNMVMDLRSEMFEHVSKLSLTFHDEKHTGMLMSLINMQAAAIGGIVMAFPPMFESLLMLIGMLTIALLIDWQVTLVSLVCVPFIYWAIGLYGTRIVPRIQRVQSLEFRSLSIVFEAMSMLRVIVGFGRQRLEHYRFTTQGRTAVEARVRLTVWQTLFSLGVTTAIALGTALVLGFGAWHVLKGQITLGELTVLIFYIAAIYQPLESISTTIGHLHQQFVFLNAALTIMDEVPEVQDKDDAIDIGRAKGELEFQDVSFSYKGRVDTLKNVSFKVPAGSRVAIVGPTGAGKTTLVSLLVRYYDPASGTIALDGKDVKDITLDCLRRQLSLVLQQPMLFSGTISDNIRYGRLEATMDEIVAAAKAANCHDFITSLPDGYDTELGEGGAQLSGGERQRICVARAFIRDAPILILDEPTSAIDSKTESVILDALENLMVGRTSFMIAHRLSTIRDADLIVVMNHGEVVEQGGHDELLARGGLYYQLYEAQTGRAAKIEAEYAIAQAEGRSAEEAAEIAIAAGAAAESAAADALAAATEAAQNPSPPAGNGTPPNANATPPAANGTPPPVSEPAASADAPKTPEQPAKAPEQPAKAEPAAPAAGNGHREGNGAGTPDVTEKVIETLENAVRQRVRAALEARERQRLESGTAPAAQRDAEQSDNGAHGNGAHDGPDGPPFSLPAGDDAGL